MVTLVTGADANWSLQVVDRGYADPPSDTTGRDWCTRPCLSLHRDRAEVRGLDVPRDLTDGPTGSEPLSHVRLILEPAGPSLFQGHLEFVAPSCSRALRPTNPAEA